MWLIEGALEVHLGEFHIRMKGNRDESRWAEASLVGGGGGDQAVLRVLGLLLRLGVWSGSQGSRKTLGFHSRDL